MSSPTAPSPQPSGCSSLLVGAIVISIIAT
jgi:hypothetical protein